MYGDTELINLCGKALSVLYRDKRIKSILFEDERYGRIVITIPYESFLYHKNLHNTTTYSLKAELKGITVFNKSGFSRTKNELIIKKGAIKQ